MNIISYYRSVFGKYEVPRKSTYIYLCLLLLSFVSFNSDLIADSPPNIKVDISQVDVIAIKIIPASQNRPGPRSIIVERADNENRHFRKIAKINFQKTKVITIFDRIAEGSQTISYRSRLVGKVSSKWSKNVSIEIKQEEPEESVEPDDLFSEVVNLDQPLVGTDPNREISAIVPDGMSACPFSAVEQIFTLTNSVRTQAGQPALSEHRSLSISSQKFSIKLALSSNLSHEGWFENITSSGFQGQKFGQNIGYLTSTSAELIMKGWLESPGHLNNIISPGFVFLGVGCVIDRKGFVWWTQDFGG